MHDIVHVGGGAVRGGAVRGGAAVARPRPLSISSTRLGPF